MREFTVKCDCKLSAERLWALRRDFETDRWIAFQEERDVQLLEETEEKRGEHTIVLRKTSCRFVNNPIPTWLRGFIKAETLTTMVTAEWNAKLYNKENCYSFTVNVPSVGDKLSLSGIQWVEPIDNTSCTVCSHVTVECNVPGVGSHVESGFQKELTRSYDRYPERIMEFMQAKGLDSNADPSRDHDTENATPPKESEPQFEKRERRSIWRCAVMIGTQRIGFETEYNSTADYEEDTGTCCCFAHSLRLVSRRVSRPGRSSNTRGMAPVRLRED